MILKKNIFIFTLLIVISNKTNTIHLRNVLNELNCNILKENRHIRQEGVMLGIIIKNYQRDYQEYIDYTGIPELIEALNALIEETESSLILAYKKRVEARNKARNHPSKKPPAIFFEVCKSLKTTIERLLERVE